jgi:amino acid transporter
VVLCLSANTSFADFPRLCRTVAEDGYLPHAFANRGRRLVYSDGICVLAALAALLLIAFDGVTDNLIPLFAVGAFLAFTLSQAGMVAHWSRQRVAGARYRMMINGIGAAATAVTTLIVVVAKFTQGAWIVVLVVPTLIAIMMAVNRHYRRLEHQTAAVEEFLPDGYRQPLVVVPIDRWSRVAPARCVLRSPCPTKSMRYTSSASATPPHCAVTGRSSFRSLPAAPVAPYPNWWY